MSKGKLIPLAIVVAMTAACSLVDPGDDPAREQPRDPIAVACGMRLEHVERIKRGYHKNRSPEITMIPRYPHFFGSFDWTSHSGPWRYMQEVPLVLYGPGWIRPRGNVDLDQEVTVADLAPTLAELMDTPFPSDRPGNVLEEALVPSERRPSAPAVVVVVVWDGGGTNVLTRWPAAWPFLESLIEDGFNAERAIVGSSPSLTPPVHATIGTGTFPDAHGIVDIPQRTRGGKIADSYANNTPSNLRVSTLAEIHDEYHDNAAQMAMFGERGWLLGMLGQGAYRDSGDRDVAILVRGGNLVSNTNWYELPDYLEGLPPIDQDVEKVDAMDGELDGAWMDHPLEEALDIAYSPVWPYYQNRVTRAVLEGEGFGDDSITDMLFTNYKAIDHVGHRYNMVNPEMEVTIEASDEALGELVATLDRTVGERRWVLALTADHGQSPDPRSVGAWPVDLKDVGADVARHFGVEVDELVEESRPLGIWLNSEVMEANDLTEEEVSRFLLGYTIEDNLRGNRELPEDYVDMADGRVFEAVFPSRDIPRIWDCARSR